MAEHPNVSVVRRLYQAFMSRDTARLAQLVGESMEFHIAGRSSLAGVHIGRDQVLKLFYETGEVTEHSIRIELHAIFGNSEHVVGLHRITATRPGGKVFNQHGCIVCHVNGSVLTDAWLTFENLREADTFWG